MPLRTLHFSIDKHLSHLSPIIPPSPLPHLPRPISHFLGYRPHGSPTTKQPLGNVLVSAWAFLGAFLGLVAVAGLFEADWISGRGAPIIVGSFGAAAVLEFNAIESPFSQPRNAILGQTIASIIGVSITKLFLLQPATLSHAQPPPYAYLAGALAVAFSSALMSLTGTIYPPAGATALLAATEPAIVGLGWLYIGIVVLATVLMLAVAALVNNVMRRWPMYWWAPMQATPAKSDDERAKVEEKDGRVHGDEEANVEGRSSSSASTSNGEEEDEGMRLIVSAKNGVVLPKGLHLSGEEWRMLRILEERMVEIYGDGKDTSSQNGHPASDAGQGDHHAAIDTRSENREDMERGSMGDAGDNRLDRVATFGSVSTLRDQSIGRYSGEQREVGRG